MYQVVIALLFVFVSTPAAAQDFAKSGRASVATGSPVVILQNNRKTFGISASGVLRDNAAAYRLLGAEVLAEKYERRRRLKWPLVITGGALTTLSLLAMPWWFIAGVFGADTQPAFYPVGGAIAVGFVGGLSMGLLGLFLKRQPASMQQRQELVDQYNSSSR